MSGKHKSHSGLLVAILFVGIALLLLLKMSGPTARSKSPSAGPGSDHENSEQAPHTASTSRPSRETIQAARSLQPARSTAADEPGDVRRPTMQVLGAGIESSDEETRQLKNALEDSGASAEAWTVRASETLERALTALDDESRSNTTLTTVECYSAGCWVDAQYPSFRAQEAGAAALYRSSAVESWPGIKMVTAPLQVSNSDSFRCSFILMRPDDDQL
jgi:hypothetical protein